MSEPTQNDPALLPLLKALLQRPIAFHRIFADIAGSAAGGLFLSQAWYWQQRTTDPDGWWFKTQEEWREEAALTRYEQQNARVQLKRLGILEEKRTGVPAKLFYRLNIEALQTRLLETTNWIAENNKLDCWKQQTISEITSEITSEILTPPPIVPPGGNGRVKVRDMTPALRRKKTYFPTDPPRQEALRLEICDTALTTWMQNKGLALDVPAQWEAFRGKALAKGYQYLVWRQAFMNWLTSDYQQPAPTSRKTNAQRAANLKAWAQKEEERTRATT